jgi:RHH-type rel operon transcriptional repressor/antitoxin RelB
MASKQVSFRTEPEKIDALDRVAEALDRDRSYVINQALDAFLEVHNWQVAHFTAAKAEADAGGPFVAHEDMVRWIESLASESELPPPAATIKKRRKSAARRR